MKKQSIPFALSILLILVSPFLGDGRGAAQPTFMWAKQMGGASSDWGSSIAVDGSGNVYTTGNFRDTADFDPGIGTFNMTSVGFQDIYVSKLDSSGNFVWAKQMGGTSSDRAPSIALDGSGNVYTTGFFVDTADFDPGAGTFNMISAGINDIFVSKLDALGNFVWAKQMGGAAIDLCFSIAIDGSGNVYTTGYFQDTADFDPGTGTFNMTSVGFQDIYVSKLDSSGNFVWAKQMGGASIDWGFSIAVDDSGNVYTTGNFRDTADFDPGIGTFNMISAGINDIFVSKLDALGNFVWAKQMGGAAGNEGFSIAVDGSGNVYTTGKFSGTSDFDPGASTFNMTSAGSFDIFVSKLDLLGNFVWAIQMGGAGLDYGNSIALDASANVYVMGDQYSITVDFDPGAGTYNVSNTGAEANFIAQYDSSGNFLCAFAITPGHNETFYDRHLAVAGCNIYITASFDNAGTDFDPGPSVYNLPYSGNFDIYVAKYDMSNCSCVPLPSPVADFTAGDTIICAEDCINFTDLSTDAPTSWQWSFPGGIPSSSTSQNPTNICYDTTGFYDIQLIVTNANGSDTLTKFDYIKVNPLPTVNLGTDTMICNGCSITLNAGTGFINYNWSTGESTQTINVDSAGTYIVEVIDANGCVGGDTIVIDISTGINPQSLIHNPKLDVHPNPNTGEFTVTFKIIEKQHINLKVFNIKGQVIYEENLSDFKGRYQNKIDLSGYAKGIYSLQLSTKEKTSNKKIIIE